VPRIFVVDDDRATRRTLEKFLGELGYEAESSGDGAHADARLREADFDLVLLDLGLPGMDGMEILANLARAASPPPVVVISGRDDMASTVQAMQRGAYDFLTKPLDIDLLETVVRRGLHEGELRRVLASHAGTAGRDGPDHVLVGRSIAMRELFKTIGQLSQASGTILITGESGSGKELVARAIRLSGPGRDRPFVAINCAAVPAGLLESELFGHVRGAFTGATADRPGRLEVAEDGTLLLDEIGEMALELQAKLLRVLQERCFERIGETRPRPLRARVLATTHRHLDREVLAGRFREDLYYRLRVVEIHVPALRERMEDLDLLVDQLLARAARNAGKAPPALAPEVLELFRGHRWPGNVRELANMLERAVVLARGGVIGPDVLPPELLARSSAPEDPGGAPPATLAEMERRHIAGMLEHTGWHKARTAELLGISRPTLDRKIRQYGLTQREGSSGQSLG
jgi:DNA-binding NtrC family response regulator